MKVAQLRLAMIRAVYAADVAKADKDLAQAAAKAEAHYMVAKAELDLALAKKSPKAKDTDKKAKASESALMKAMQRLQAPGVTYTSLQATFKAQEGPDDTTHTQVQSYPSTSTGRRLALAQWIADARHPLTARVLVNHVWLRHFGTPLVADMDDFGRRSLAPLHQDILDTLAVDFMRHGWSLKHLQRTLVLSDLYQRQSSNAQADDATLAADPDNAHYWRMNPRRLESQAVRDSLLHLAGQLDLTLGGPSIDPSKSETSLRRSLYFVQNADTEHRLLGTFDNANVLECYRRNESIVPQQALALTNSQLSHDCAKAMAARLAALPDTTFVEQAFLAILGRSPKPTEQALTQQGLQSLRGNRALLLQTLFNHNDFVTLR